MAVSGQQLLAIASKFLGQPYVWGGQSPGGFDCSGLMWYVAKQMGINIPRTSNAQLAAGIKVSSNNIQVGDMVYFDVSHNGTADHVGMYAGNGMVLVADNPGVPIHIVPLSSEDRISGITRMPGVVTSPNPNDTGLSSAQLAGMENSLGLNHTSLVPSARPTFDMWGSLGLQAPNSAIMNENYGLSAAFLDSDPELANLYSKAVSQTWSTDQFTSALQQTQWWQTNSASTRALLEEKKSDPAKYQQDLNGKIALINEQAVKLGVHLSAQSLQNVASSALMLNQNDAQINGVLSKYLQLSKDGHFTGYAGQVELGMREYARDMGVPLTDEYVQNAVTQITGGSDTLQARRAYIQSVAETTFPAYADQINKGVTVGQIAAPYLGTQAKLWEVDPNKVDLFDPTLRAALQYKDQTGAAAVKPLYNFETDLRKDPKWLKTNNSRESVMATANKVLSDMGLSSHDMGAASTTRLDVTQNSRADLGGLSGMTNYPTLEGGQFKDPGAPPTGAGAQSATGLAKDNSFKVTNF